MATGFVNAITASCEPVRHFPQAGAARGQLAPGMRVIFHGAYAIYYRPLPDAVVIIRVVHAARDAAALADRGGFPG